MQALPTQSLLRKRLDYLPETGELIWREPHPQARNIKPGDPFGCICKLHASSRSTKEYINGSLEGTLRLAHRLIWVWMTGEDPGNMVIDHINQDGLDNRWENLRKVTKSQNNANSPGHVKRRKSRFKGVYKRRNRYEVQVRRNGKIYCAPGSYATEEEAAAAHKELVTKLDSSSDPASRDEPS